MQDDDSIPKKTEELPEKSSGVSRRDFLKISGLAGAAVPAGAGPKVVMAGGQEVKVYGPGRVPMEFTVNGKKYQASLEPRVTLLDALRDSLDLTGAKRVCDRGECGACTVLVDDKAVYACSILAIEAQGKRITPVESLTGNGNPTPIPQAFLPNDPSPPAFSPPT